MKAQPRPKSEPPEFLVVVAGWWPRVINRTESAALAALAAMDFSLNNPSEEVGIVRQ